jgi:diguanylate cyclase (GGDEF)-like protein
VRKRGESAVVIVAWSAAALAAVGVLDYVTGIELRVFPLYFVPVLIVSLRFGRWPGLAAAGAAALTWLGANQAAGRDWHPLALTVANTLVMVIAFGTIALLGSALRRGLERERVTSRTDGLTGLLNGRGFHEAASAELVRARRYRRPLTLACLDLDDFKAINDRLGHDVGDATLARVAQLMRAVLRRNDLVARLGGDDFAILLPESDRAAAEPALQKVLVRLGRVAAEGEPAVTASIGAICYGEPPGEIEPLLRAADELVSAVKAAGKNALRCESR